MKKLICILVCVAFWNCGGDAGLRITTTEDDIIDDHSIEKDLGNYPGFTEYDQKPSMDYDFYNGFFDKHPEAVNTVTYEFDSEQTDDLGNISTENISTSTYVNYSGTASQVFALYDKYNVVNVQITWNPNENYENREDLRFFLCDIDKENTPFNDEYYTIDPNEWNKGKKNQRLEVNIDSYNENKKIGLCMQYKTYLPVLYDALEIKVYKTQSYNVTLAHVGVVNDNIRQKAESRIKETLNRAGVEINFTQEKTYQVPEDFENFAHRERQLPKDYLYVQVGTNGQESNCYNNNGGDLFWLKSKVQSDIGYGHNERRTAVILNRKTVKFWTIKENYNPCTTNLEDRPKEDGFFGYIVGILNNKDYSECLRDYPYSGDVYYKIVDGNGGWYDVYGQSIDDNISTYISPKCHVLVDLDRMGQPNWDDDDTKAQRYYRSLMPSNALGITTPAQPIGNRTGLMSFSPPDDEVVLVHELTHLCGLSDVEKPENNLMYQSKKGGTKLGNIPLKAKLDDKDKFGSGMERQWDCLHDENYADGCLDQAYRLLNF